jgi:hypothetical protein
MEATAVT